MDVLVVDVGGTNVKMLAAGQPKPRRFASGRRLTAAGMVERVRKTAADWPHAKITLGLPCACGPDGPELEPGNLGGGWLGFDYAGAFGKPVRVVNDAALQALGAYDGGRMLFLGLGTGLGSALVTDRVVVPLELGDLPYTRRQTMADRLGKKGLALHGPDHWLRDVRDIVRTLKSAFAADYVMLGGGNAKRVDPLPADTRRGGNADAFVGGFRLWDEGVTPHDLPPAAGWRVVR